MTSLNEDNAPIVEWEENGTTVVKKATKQNVVFENKLLFKAFLVYINNYVCSKKLLALFFLLFFCYIFLNGMYNNYVYLSKVYVACINSFKFLTPSPQDCIKSSIFRAFFKTLNHVTSQFSKMLGLSVKEFIASLFGNFNYLEKLGIFLFIYSFFYNLICFSIEIIFRYLFRTV